MSADGGEVLGRVEALLIEEIAQLLLEGRALAVRHVLSSLDCCLDPSLPESCRADEPAVGAA